MMLLAGNGALAADIDNGRQLAQRHCGACHALAQGGGQKMGPTLWNVVGRRSGTARGYHYSDAARDLKIVWTPQALREHLAAPANLIHANRTKFPGLAEQEQLDDVIAYLQTLN